jgi:predicted 3-demethylubiquinone-9 3-methyltransferase (glyoxalase superfamily)
MTTITPFLWFTNQAEEAAKYYVSIFRNSKIINTTRYGKEGFEIHKMPEGTVMAIDFDLDGQQFTALNGGSSISIY